MVTQGKGVNYRVCLINILKEILKAVVIDALTVIAAVQAAEAAALEGKVRNVHKARFIRKSRGEVLHHRAQALVLLAQVADYDGVIVLGLLRRLKAAFVFSARSGRSTARRLGYPILNAESGITEKRLKLASPLLGQQILRPGGEPLYNAHAHIIAVILNEALRGHVIKMQRGRKLRRKNAGEVSPRGLQQFNEPVQLRGDEKIIHRIGEDKQVAGGDGLGRAAHVTLKNVDTGAGVQKLKLMLWKSLFKIQAALQRDAEPAARRTVYDEDLHARSFLCLLGVCTV